MSKGKLDRIRELIEEWRTLDKIHLEPEYLNDEISPLTIGEQLELIEFIEALTKDPVYDDLLQLLRNR